MLGDVQGPRLPVNSEGRISFPSDAALVEATSMLDWQIEVGAAPPRVYMAHFQMLYYAFSTRCDLPRSPADMAATRTRTIFTMCLTNAAWVRILTELVDSRLIDAIEERDTLAEYKEAMASLSPIQPSNLQITAGAWSPVESFDAPAVPTRAGRRRAAVPGMPASPGPVALSIVEEADLTRLLT